MKILCLLALICFTLTSYSETFSDDFSKTELAERQADRGDWQFKDNIAYCQADDELYKKYNNHGPILRWPGKYTSGTVEFEMKAVDCSRVVLTFNGEGHIFRLTLADPDKNSKWITNRIIAWETQSSKQNKGDTIKPKGMPNLQKINNQWVKLKIAISGNNTDLKIGDFTTNITHSALARHKKVFMLSFAHGALSLKNFKFTP